MSSEMSSGVHPASALGDSAPRQIAEVFADAFGNQFTAFARTPRTLVAAFEHAFVTELFWVVLDDDGHAVGIAALSDGIQQSMVFNGRELRRHLGLVRGTLARVILGRAFSHPIPDAGPTTGSIEFVGTTSAHRGEGIATALIEHLSRSGHYQCYVLAEVADSNHAALRLYEKLGFREYHRKELRHSGRTGITAYISLRRQTPRD
ncbi:GNAT family N-acetyltransferase [Gordonia terrae]|nr:GNAT family N-acetyltransferase [Gordonia terrae]